MMSKLDCLWALQIAAMMPMLIVVIEISIVENAPIVNFFAFYFTFIMFLSMFFIMLENNVPRLLGCHGLHALFGPVSAVFYIVITIADDYPWWAGITYAVSAIASPAVMLYILRYKRDNPHVIEV
jgi:hypothetical protein